MVCKDMQISPEKEAGWRRRLNRLSVPARLCGSKLDIPRIHYFYSFSRLIYINFNMFYI